MDAQKPTHREALDAVYEARHLRHLAEEADVGDMRNSTPPTVTVKVRLAEITKLLNSAVFSGDAQKAVEALRAFDALSEPDKRRILRGWRPVANRPRAVDLARVVAAGFPLARVLRIVPGVNAATGRQCFAFLEDDAPVQLIVREGAARQDVRQLLRWFDALIDRDWDRLIEGDPSPALPEQTGPPTGARTLDENPAR